MICAATGDDPLPAEEIAAKIMDFGQEYVTEDGELDMPDLTAGFSATKENAND